jgi:THO complex subunit 5
MGSQAAQELADFCGELLAARGDAAAGDLSGFLAAGAVKIVELREAHRAVCEEGEALREASAGAKAQLDAASLHLQNLLYEKHHYEKEIRACRAFRSAYTDAQLELIPPEDFAAAEPAAAPAPAAVAADEAHALMLRRLDHELRFRQATLQELDPLKARRDSLAADVAQRRAAVGGLDAEVANLRAAADRARAQFDIPAVAPSESNRLAALLPLPLYVLYTQFSAAAAAGGLPAEVRVAGAGAAALAEQLQRAVFRSPSAPAVAAEAALAEARAGAGAGGGAFPLGVAVAVAAAAGRAPSLVASFHYMPASGVVTVAGDTPEQDAQLAALFEEDESSGVAGRGAGGAAGAAAGAPGKAYGWAQWAAGLDFLPAVPVAGGAAAPALPEVAAAVHRYQQERTAAAVLGRLLARVGAAAAP